MCVWGVVSLKVQRPGDVVRTSVGGVIAGYELLDGVLETKLWSSAGIVHTVNHWARPSPLFLVNRLYCLYYEDVFCLLRQGCLSFLVLHALFISLSPHLVHYIVYLPHWIKCIKVNKAPVFPPFPEGPLLVAGQGRAIFFTDTATTNLRTLQWIAPYSFSCRQLN